MTREAKCIIFTGRVQGVGFRFTALNYANRYDLTGQVRNVHDGTVEMIAQGPAQDIADCIRDIKSVYEGSLRETKITEIPLNPQLTDFKITF